MVNSITGLGYAFTNNGFFTKILKNFILFLMKISFRKNNTKLLTLNNADFNYLLKENVVESNQISVTHGTGIDCVKYSPNTRLQQDTFTVLMASRLLWDKGIKEFVEAAEIISEDNPQIRFLLAGAPDHQNPASASMSWVSDVKREGRVELLGHIADMPTLLKVADVVVLPSYREGLPTILLEAAACGIPAITTDVPGCSDAVLDGETGLVVGVKNAAELARAIMHLHENRRLHASMGTAARARSLSLYEVKVVADQISQHYLS
jgi:glycosyltransferase involved in cell wall biosynthesis